MCEARFVDSLFDSSYTACLKIKEVMNEKGSGEKSGESFLAHIRKPRTIFGAAIYDHERIY